MSPHVSHFRSSSGTSIHFHSHRDAIWNASNNRLAGQSETERGILTYNEKEEETDSDAEDDLDIIEQDGSRKDSDNDLPGQHCVFIPSGDHFNEMYRLATFRQFPITCPVSKIELARRGFYYTGFADRVKCFSCGASVENWMVGDDPREDRWHKEDCKMQHNCDISNIPFTNIPQRQQEFNQIIRSLNLRGNQCSDCLHTSVSGMTSAMNMLTVGADSSLPVAPAFQLAKIQSQQHERYLLSINLCKEVDRRKTFADWPSYPAPLLVGSLAENGFFYLGNLDRAQCFSCSGVLRNWSPNDDVMEQHRRHFPHCRLVQGIERSNIPLSSAERRSVNVELQARITAIRSVQSIQEPPDPTPEEQQRLAHYFPCRDAINYHMRQEEKRLETFDSRWPSHRIKASPESIAKAGFFFLGEGDKAKCYYCNGGLQNWEENDEPWTEHAKWFPECEFVIRRKGIEFVRRLKQQHPNLNRPAIRNPVSFDVPDLPNSAEITVVMDIPGAPTLIKNSSENRGRSQKRHITSMESGERFEETRIKECEQHDHGELSEREAGEMLRKLQVSGICRHCQTVSADMLAIPCGHLGLCSKCSKNKKHCITCNNQVERFLKVYRS